MAGAQATRTLSRCLDESLRGSECPWHGTCMSGTLKCPPLVLHLLSHLGRLCKIESETATAQRPFISGALDKQ